MVLNVLPDPLWLDADIPLRGGGTVMKISIGIYKFSHNRSLITETLHIFSLCIDSYAFKPGEKRWLDLTIVDKHETLIVRIRENVSPCDLLAYLSAGPVRGYGILLIHRLADNFAYRRSMGLNNLIIHLKK